MPIQNAKDIPLANNTGTLPNMGDAILNWFQKMTFEQVAKVVNGLFQVSETATSFSFMGVWQSAQPTQLEMQAQGQRKWNWWTCHSQPNVPLNVDDVITYLGIQYRVMSKIDHTLYGYIEYRLINDYTGVSP